MSPPRRLRLVCVDDNDETRALFSLLLDNGREFETVARLAEVGTLELCIAETSPDIVVLDWWIRGDDASKAMRSAARRYPNVRFLVLSSDDDPAQVDRAFAHGAAGYAIKDGNLERLMSAIRSVAAGQTVRPVGGARHGFR